MRILTTERQWEDVGPAHQASVSFIEGSYELGQVRLADGPGGQPRFASYHTIYETNPWLWGVVNTIAGGMTRMYLQLLQRRGIDEAEPVFPSNRSAAGRLALALRYPAGLGLQMQGRRRVSRVALVKNTVTDRLVEGNGLWEILWNGRAEVDGFRPHAWRNVSYDDSTGVYTVMDDGRTRHLIPEDVCHFGLWETPGNVTNTSPIKSLRATVALFDAVQRHLTSYFNRGASLTGHLKVGGPAAAPGDKGSEARKLMRQEIAQLYSGVDNAGAVMISSGDYRPIGQTPDSSRVIELAKQSRDEIFAVYQVPGPVMGVLEHAIMSNVHEMREHYYRDLIGKWAATFESDIETQVINPVSSYVNLEPRFDVEGSLRQELEKTSGTIPNLRQLLSLDELRMRYGLKPLNIPGVSDVPLDPLNMQPIGQEPEEEEEEGGDEPTPEETMQIVEEETNG